MVQTILINKILRPISIYTNKLTGKTKSFLITTSILLIIILQFLTQAGTIQIRFIYLTIIDCFLLGVILLCGIEEQLNPVKFRRIPLAALVITNVSIIISAFVVNIDLIAYVIALGGILPLICIIYANNNYHKLIASAIIATQISFWLLLFISIIFVPLSQESYRSIFLNQNSFAMYLCAVIICCFQMFFSKKINKVSFWCSLITMGLAIIFLMMTSARGGQIATLFSVFCTIILLVAFFKRNKIKIYITKTLLLITSIVLCFYLLPYIFLGGNILVSSINYSAIKSNVKIDLSHSVDKNKDRYSNSLKTDNVNSITTGRADIWKIYIKEMNLIGNNSSEKKLYRKDGQAETRSAHSAIIQLSYEGGILAGIFYFIFNVSGGIIAICVAIKRRKDEYAIFPLIVILSYGVISVVESALHPFTHLIVLLYYFVQVPILVKID